MAKTLQEDPSCQLCIVLQRYIRQTDMKKIEANVSEQRLPPLSTLRQVTLIFIKFTKFSHSNFQIEMGQCLNIGI